MAPNLPHHGAPATWSAARTVAAKELRGALRDPQTLIYAVLLPLALYPALFWVMIQVSSLVESRRETRDVTVWLALDAEAADGSLAERRLAAAAKALSGGAGNPSDGETPGPQRLKVEQREQALAADGLRALFDRESPSAADAPDAVLLARGEGPALALYYDSARPDSQLARRRVESRLEAGAKRARDDLVAAAGRPLAELRPLALNTFDLASSVHQGAVLVSMLLPMLLVLMALMGAFYPAVDLTAGEWERRSHETTLLLPVPRRAVQLGKLAAVCALSSLAALLNLFGVALAANHLFAMLGAEDLRVAIGAPALLLALPLALVLVVLTSAALLGLASLTRTFKQGQSLLGGVQMVFLLPAAASVLPGLGLGTGLAATPVVGLALALRAALRAETLAGFAYGPWAVALAAHAVYALAAVILALRLLDLEFSDQPPRPLARLWSALGRSAPPQTQP